MGALGARPSGKAVANGLFQNGQPFIEFILGYR
jgi:hypothetical protein